MTQATGQPTAADALALVERRLADAERRNAEAAESVRRTTQIAPTGRSDKGWVTVTLDSAALVTAIDFDQAAPVSSPESLARAVQQAHDRAVIEWRDQVSQIAEDELGDDKVRADVQQAATRSVPVDVVERIEAEEPPAR